MVKLFENPGTFLQLKKILNSHRSDIGKQVLMLNQEQHTEKQKQQNDWITLELNRTKVSCCTKIMLSN